MNRKLSEQEVIRRQKLQKLIAANIKPFGFRFETNTTINQIIEQFGDLSAEQLEAQASNQTIIIAGRIMRKRESGKAGFCNLQDHTGLIQIYVRQESIGEKDFKIIWTESDLGDIIGIKGQIMRTKKGELSVKATTIYHLTKALRPLPDKFHGLSNVEERYRRRYLDLIVNPEARQVALLRPKIIRAIQRYLDGRDFIEVETPILHPILGGAAAQPFKTHHNALDMDFYLRIATELPLKRLIVGGMNRVYEIGRLFRNEGVSRKHNPEFTSMEVYQSFGDYRDMMRIIEDLFKVINREVFANQNIYQNNGRAIDISQPFQQITMIDSIKEVTGIDFSYPLPFAQALQFAQEKGIKVEKFWNSNGYIINAFFEEFVEKTLIRPTFVFGYPIEISPLAKLQDDNPHLTDRFEFFINGQEYANAFSELNDPIDQLQRFENQVREKNLGNDEASEVDSDFVQALEYGLPPTSGLGLGIDRLVMFFTQQPTIREVILFPHNKIKK